jgi:hypothetical protein
MKRTASILLALSLGATASPAVSQVALPTGFDGLYVPDGETCGSASQITVKDGNFIMMDGAMTVTDLIEDPVNPRRVDASLALSGGGADWTDSAVITLADDGQSLHFAYADGTEVVWARCD